MRASPSATLVALTILSLGCKSARTPAPSAGPAATAKRELVGFTQVDVGGALDAQITAGPAFSVELTGDPAAVAQVTTKVKGTTLEVMRENSGGAPKVKATIALPVLHGVEISGASGAEVSGLAGEALRIGASGASRVKLTGTKGQHMAIDATGASSIEIAGAIDNLVIDVSGASEVKAKELVVSKAVIDVSGASRLELFGKDVSGDATGGSTVEVRGAPARLAVETSGASSVKNLP